LISGMATRQRLTLHGHPKESKIRQREGLKGLAALHPACFRWEPATLPSPMSGMLEPLLDLRLALGLAAGAATRLVRGLAAGVTAAVAAVVAKAAAIL